MERSTQSALPTESPTPSAGDDSAAADRERIAAITEAGKEAKAPPLLVRHFIATGATLDDAKAAFAELDAKGVWSDKNLATFHKVK